MSGRNGKSNTILGMKNLHDVTILIDISNGGCRQDMRINEHKFRVIEAASLHRCVSLAHVVAQTVVCTSHSPDTFVVHTVEFRAFPIVVRSEQGRLNLGNGNL